MPDIRALLQHPSLYTWFQRAIGNARMRQVYIRDYVRPREGELVLDIGCGPGDILDFLQGVRYHGVDLSTPYIESARARYGDRGTFEIVDAAELAVTRPGSFDVVMANGILHHLPDDAVRHLLRAAASLLRPGGRWVSLDGCYVAGQSRVARHLLSRDRGEFVREAERYVDLVREAFPRVESTVHHDLLRIPYTHLFVRALKD